MTSKSTKLFASSNSKDHSRIKRLVSVLEEEGFSVWWDAHFGSEIDWQNEIELHLDTLPNVWSFRGPVHSSSAK